MLLKEEINKYLNYCKFQKELDDKTIKAYKADLEQFITVIGENNPDKEVLNAYLVYLHRMYKQKTVKRKIASVKALFHYLEEEELIEINPFHKVKTKFREEVILPKIIPRDIIEQLLNHLYKERSIKEYSEWRKKIILRDIAVVETLFSTGLRISELCHLQNKYVDLKNGVLCIQGKGGKERYLQIGNNDVLSILNAYKKYFEDEIKKQGYFFVNRYGNALSEQSARSMIHKYAGEIQADINITPHMFRHSFATYLMEEDVNIRYIQKMLGHASITTTEIYTYVTTEKEKEILQTRHPRNKINMGNLSQKDYVEYKMCKENRLRDLEKQEKNFREQEVSLERDGETYLKAVRALIKLKHEQVLTRELIESLIDKIYVYPGKRVEVLFTYSDALVERQVKK